MARHMNPGGSTNKTIDAIDRKRERERYLMIKNAREKAPDLAVALVQRLLDQKILEIDNLPAIQSAFERQLTGISELEEFEMQYKIAPLRTLTQDPNFVSLYITQYVIEDLIDHPAVLDVFGDDLDVYKAVDSILSLIRPK